MVLFSLVFFIFLFHRYNLFFHEKYYKKNTFLYNLIFFKFSIDEYVFFYFSKIFKFHLEFLSFHGFKKHLNRGHSRIILERFRTYKILLLLIRTN